MKMVTESHSENFRDITQKEQNQLITDYVSSSFLLQYCERIRDKRTTEKALFQKKHERIRVNRHFWENNFVGRFS